MQYMKRVPIEDEVKSKQLLADGWTPIVAPWGNVLHSIAMVLIAVVLIAINGAYLWLLFGSVSLSGTIALSSGIGSMILHMLLLLVAACITLTLHEWIHAMFIPRVLSSKKTYWGLHGVLGFVYTEEEMTRGRYLLVSVMPLFVISYLIPGVLALGHQLNVMVCIICLLNAGGACSDILNVIYVYMKVPRHGYIVSNGSASFYKESL